MKYLLSKKNASSIIISVSFLGPFKTLKPYAVLNHEFLFRKALKSKFQKAKKCAIFCRPLPPQPPIKYDLNGPFDFRNIMKRCYNTLTG